MTTLVQHKVGETALNQSTVAITVSSTSAGNLGVVGAINTGTLTVSGVADNASGGSSVYTQVPGAAFNGTATDKGDVWVCTSLKAGVTTVTITFSVADTSIKDGFFCEVSGLNSPVTDGISVLSAQTGAGDSTDTGATVTTTVTNGFVFGLIVTSNSITQNPKTGNEFTSGGDVQPTTGNAQCTLISTTAATHTPVWLDNAAGATFGAATVAFKAGVLPGTAIGLPTSFHPGRSPGIGGISSARFQTNWWPYTVASPVVTSQNPFSITIASLVTFKRIPPKTKIQFNKQFGKPTTSVKPKKTTQVVFSSKERTKRRFIITKKILTKTFGKSTKAPKPLAIKVKLQRLVSKRIVTKAQLGKKPKSTVVIVSVRPQKLRTILQALNRRKIATQTRLGKVIGKPTKKPNIVPPHILQFVAQQTMRKNKFVLGKHQLERPVTIAVVTGSSVVFYDGLSVADGLTYHHGLDRPTIVLISVGGGKFTVVKSSSLSDENAAMLSKETYIIDGDLP